MPFRNMTLAELARHIGMDAREVKRLADKGVLPGRLIGGEWRFNRAEMLEWLQQDMHSLDERHIQNLDRAMSADQQDAILSAILPLEGIDLQLRAKSRASVLRELVALAERTGLLYDRAELIDALEEREGLSSTALAGGFALPHPAKPMPYATAEPLVCVARVPPGLPFNAPDGRLTDVFVLVCCHDERQHLLALARLALLFNDGLAAVIRDLNDPEELLEHIITTERELLDTRR